MDERHENTTIKRVQGDYLHARAGGLAGAWLGAPDGFVEERGQPATRCANQADRVEAVPSAQTIFIVMGTGANSGFRSRIEFRRQRPAHDGLKFLDAEGFREIVVHSGLDTSIALSVHCAGGHGNNPRVRSLCGGPN